MEYTAVHPTAVVILSYNSQKWHELFLPKIVQESLGHYDVFVVDHASTQPISDDFKQKFPEVHWLKLEENHGFAWGYDEALKKITAEFYILLSADFEVTSGWYPPLLAQMKASPNLAALQPKIRYYKERQKFEYAGAAGGYIDAWGYLFCRGRIFSELEEDQGQYDQNAEIFWASGGCLMIRAELYHKFGGLDADFFAHMEEVDLCWRLKNAGYQIGVVTDCTVFHVGGSVISYGSPAKTFYNYRNSYFLFLKNERAAKLLWLIPLRLCLDGVSGAMLLLQGQPKNTWAIVRAHFSFYGQFFKLLRKRKALRALRSDRNTAGIIPIKILPAFFFKKKKKFSDLGIEIKPL